MSDYHVLQANGQRTKFTVVMHHEVPAEDNAAGQTFALCLVEDEFVTNATRLPAAHIDAAEVTQIEAGEILEESVEFECSPGLTNAEIRDQIDSLFTARATKVETQIRARYAFWGFGRDIP